MGPRCTLANRSTLAPTGLTTSLGTPIRSRPLTPRRPAQGVCPANDHFPLQCFPAQGTNLRTAYCPTANPEHVVALAPGAGPAPLDLPAQRRGRWTGRRGGRVGGPAGRGQPPLGLSADRRRVPQAGGAGVGQLGPRRPAPPSPRAGAAGGWAELGGVPALPGGWGAGVRYVRGGDRGSDPGLTRCTCCSSSGWTAAGSGWPGSPRIPPQLGLPSRAGTCWPIWANKPPDSDSSSSTMIPGSAPVSTRCSPPSARKLSPRRVLTPVANAYAERWV
jgi:hypothetical protein